MEDIRRELSEAYEKAALYRRVDARLKQLRADAEALEHNRKRLESRLEMETDEADKLETGGMSVVVSKLLGTHEAQINQAREDRYTAKLKLDEAGYSLEQIRRYMTQLEAEHASLEGSEDAYAALYAQRMHMLMHSGSNAEYRIAALLQEIEQTKASLRKISEAEAAGQRVVERLQEAYDELEEADEYSGRGGLLVRVGALDTADSIAQETQSSLDMFNAKLAEICVIPDCEDRYRNIRFAEVFLDDLVLGWLKPDRLERSMENLQKAKADVQSVLERLKSKAESEQARLRSLEDELLVLVMGA